MPRLSDLVGKRVAEGRAFIPIPTDSTMIVKPTDTNEGSRARGMLERMEVKIGPSPDNALGTRYLEGGLRPCPRLVRPVKDEWHGGGADPVAGLA